MVNCVSSAPLRLAARVIVLDKAGRALLIRFLVDRPDGPFAFWATPGGEIEPGETEAEAAARELKEELGLDLQLTGPVFRSETSFWFGGRDVINRDVFFAARYDGGMPKLSYIDEAERRALREVRWWTADEIDAAGDVPVFPLGLADIVRGLGI